MNSILKISLIPVLNLRQGPLFKKLCAKNVTYNKLIFLLLICFLLSCKKELKQYQSSIFEKDNFVERNLTLELINSVKIEDEMHVSSFFTTKEYDVFLFDLTSGKIVKFNYGGKKISDTGGFGRGPNEYFPDSFVQLTYCGGDEFYSNDWNLPRFHVYDLDLEVKKIVNLNATPYDITCVNNNKLAVLYSNVPRIDIIKNNGNIEKSIRLDSFLDHNMTKESIFKHFIYTEQQYFFAYYFKPLFVIYDTFNQSLNKTLLSKTLPESVTTASRNLMVKENELHLFYFNMNQTEDKNFSKVTHVFDKKFGEYCYSYNLADRIKNYMFISTNKMITIEDSLRIGFYNYYFDE